MLLVAGRKLVVTGTVFETRSAFEQEVENEFAHARKLLMEFEKSGRIDYGVLAQGTYRPVLANIIYALPDQPLLCQEYVWQSDDLAPRYPVLHRFLDWWQRKLDGKVQLVEVDGDKLVTPEAYCTEVAHNSLLI